MPKNSKRPFKKSMSWNEDGDSFTVVLRNGDMEHGYVHHIRVAEYLYLKTAMNFSKVVHLVIDSFGSMTNQEIIKFSKRLTNVSKLILNEPDEEKRMYFLVHFRSYNHESLEVSEVMDLDEIKAFMATEEDGRFFVKEDDELRYKYPRLTDLRIHVTMDAYIYYMEYGYLSIFPFEDEEQHSEWLQMIADGEIELDTERFDHVQSEFDLVDWLYSIDD